MEWRAAMDRTLAPHGLTQAQYLVLAPLYGLTQSGMRPSQRELGDVTGLDAVYVSKLVRALERAGFVARTPKPTDPRAVELTLTESGKAVFGKAVADVRELRERMMAPVGGIDGAQSAELAATLRALLAESLKPAPPPK